MNTFIQKNISMYKIGVLGGISGMMGSFLFSKIFLNDKFTKKFIDK